MKGERGGRGSLLRSLAHEMPRRVGGPPGGMLAAVARRGLGGTVAEADERAKRGGVMDLVRRKQRMRHGRSPRMETAAREPLSPALPSPLQHPILPLSIRRRRRRRSACSGSSCMQPVRVLETKPYGLV
jgi:hypothetical protein